MANELETDETTSVGSAGDNSSLTADEIIDFESLGSAYLFNLDPATGNLFMLTKIEGISDADKATKVLRYRVKSVKLDNTIGIDFDTNKILLPGNPLCVTGIKESHSFTIEWVEDSFFRVQKLHQNWLKKWFENKTLVDGTDGKFLSFTFKVFCFKNESENFSPSLKPFESYTLTLKDCAPLDLSDFSFSYDEQESGKRFTGKYIAKTISIDAGATDPLPSDSKDAQIKF